MIFFFFLVVFSVPFNNPDETEEKVGYGDQQVGQWQIVSGLGKVYFVHLVIAVEKIGPFQKALQVKHKKVSEETKLVFLPGTIKCESHILTPPDSRSVMCS